MKAFYDRLTGEFAKIPYIGMIPFQIAGAAVIWTNMPAAETEYRGTTVNRVKVDLSNTSQCRICARIAVGGATNAKLKVQYSINESSWIDISSLTFGSTTGTKISSWSNMPEGAKGDIFLRLVGVDGNGTADPSFGMIVLEVK